MKETLDKIVFASTIKELRKATVYGKLDTTKISLFNIVSYFLKRKELIEELKPSTFKEVIERLEILRENMLWEYSNKLCSYRESSSISGDYKINTPPRIDDKYITNEEEYTFTINDFLTNYTDDQNDRWNKLTIFPLDKDINNLLNTGLLMYNGVEVEEEITIDILGLPKTTVLDLKYSRGGLPLNRESEQVIIFKISDENLNSLYSDNVNIFIRTLMSENLPPNIGDIDIIVENNVTTVLDYDIFTTQMNPSYSDPEGDELDAIRIESIPGTNEGRFVYLNADIQVGDVISANDLRNGELVHIGPTTASINTDYFEFAARDVGSLIWVR